MLLAYGRGLLTMRLVANRLPSLGAAVKKVRIMKPPPDRAALSNPGQTRFSICENQYKTYQKQQTIEFKEMSEKIFGPKHSWNSNKFLSFVVFARKHRNYNFQTI